MAATVAHGPIEPGAVPSDDAHKWRTLIVGAIVAFAGALLSLLCQLGHDVEGPAGAV